MEILEHIPVGSKTTMRIGGTARWYGDIATKEDMEFAMIFAKEHQIPLIVLGGGSNTIFTNEEVDALVVRIKADTVTFLDGSGSSGPRPQAGTLRQSSGQTPAPNKKMVKVQSGKILASLINELGEQGLDLSALTGIPGTIGGAIFGNAGQGPKGTWLDSYIVNVTSYINGEWRTLSRDECQFRYRESIFKDSASKSEDLGAKTEGKLNIEEKEITSTSETKNDVKSRGDHVALREQTNKRTNDHSSPIPNSKSPIPPLIWEAQLEVPPGDPTEIHNNIEALLQKRFETQPHLKTAGSCFKAIGGTPAWQLIDKAGLRGLRIGDIEISPKHANFLMNVGKGMYSDAKQIVERVKAEVGGDLEVEMRFIERDGSVAF